MIKKVLQSLVVIIFVINFSNLALAASKEEQLNKISEDLINIKRLLDDGILDKTTYENSRNKLLKRKEKILNKDKPKKTKKDKERTTQLEKELEVIKKLFDDGLLTKEQYEQTKEVLIEKNTTREEIVQKKSKPYTLNVLRKAKSTRTWEKTQIIYGNYTIEVYRAGGIKVVRNSDGKKLAIIIDNLNIKYFNNGQNFISAKINKTIRDNVFQSLDKTVSSVLDVEGDDFILKKKEKVKHDPNANKLELFIEGDKILHIEGRYNKKFHAMFYQVLTRDFQPFHFFINLSGRPNIGLNMGLFNKKIDRAIRAAKEKIAEEYDVSMEEIDKIIEEKLGESIEDSINQSVEEAVSASVAEAIEQTVGEAMADALVSAIEQATCEAIEYAVTSELAAEIDAEIAYAVSIGIEEAAVTAGWQAYFDVLAQGGTAEEASAAAYKACGSACDNY